MSFKSFFCTTSPYVPWACIVPWVTLGSPSSLRFMLACHQVRFSFLRPWLWLWLWLGLSLLNGFFILNISFSALGLPLDSFFSSYRLWRVPTCSTIVSIFFLKS